MNRTIKSLVTATTATAALAAVLFSAGGASAATLPTHETHWAGYYATAGTQPVYMAVATVTIPATPPATTSSACPHCGLTAVPTG
jgi:hypothetical protein